MKTTLTALALSVLSATAWAQANPVGLWRTIDDETKQEKSLVRISDAGGVLSGKVEKIADPTKANAVCEACTDDRKGKPVVGMTIIRNAKQGDDKELWEGGEILDPNNGKTYRLRMKPLEGGKKLEVRGYVGPFHRNQIWIRVE
ncbi:DUF2147 domain-containing protein [Ideonella paludis]|uniref:DUF2147 domain-containing protein n=1 Tax=Ideonella paludis TaxID=1233411 RepID=A0ABS5DW11_9BURK|nr:DUF2147 domain-containing protein [Ideonella paludis]MBQ0935338.1 DUF2147 domain-containing protein [Ideonella paludis]